MKYSVRLTTRAEEDVAGVLDWFRENKATAAGGRWYHQLMSRIDTLEKNPERCSLAAEAEDLGIEVRELLFGKCRGQYRWLFDIRGKTVNILRVWHSARDAITRKDL